MKWTRRTVAILLIIRISAASSFSPIAALGGHPKPAIDRQLKTGHHA